MQRMGFESQFVAFETIPVREQLRIAKMTDLLIGVHGNELMWLQVLPLPGSSVVELVGVWYTPYALLWGHSYFHSTDANNPEYKRRGDYNSVAHNMTEIEELWVKAKEAVDRTRCGETAIEPKIKKTCQVIQQLCTALLALEAPRTETNEVRMHVSVCLCFSHSVDRGDCFSNTKSIRVYLSNVWLYVPILLVLFPSCVFVLLMVFFLFFKTNFWILSIKQI
ncbi:hypothetical protein MOQ_004934 [Trypanosoma cruzi marinkellei]|uniref:Glycosyltransferase n=1 Tax=Trypanosoma cruzi marinkellei TaxID=85056 RepID=K2NQQ6_TRYCR|nr:hypothetical protein MOQ_004934 [Trypanosoma cruzi marinkellei]